MRPDTIKFLEDNTDRRTLSGINHSYIFFDPSSIKMEIKTKINKWATIWPCNYTLGYISRYDMKNIIWKDTCIPKFIAAVFTIAKTWRQPKRPLTEEWIKRMGYICTMKYYSATKKNEIMSFAATWMDLEIVMPSEVSQTEKEKYHTVSLICGI